MVAATAFHSWLADGVVQRTAARQEGRSRATGNKTLLIAGAAML